MCSSNHNTQATGDTLTADPTVDSTENGHFLYIKLQHTNNGGHTDKGGHTDSTANCGLCSE